MLLKTSIKKNLYYEIKDKVTEETFDGISVKRRPTKCRVYGSTSSHQKRNLLIEMLHQRVQHHRDKFATKELYDELCTMVVKPNGKTEHADDAHDDLIFSYLWALYVFYHGEDLVNRFHLMKTEIYTDDHYDETSYSLEEEYMEGEDLDPAIFKDSSDPTNKMVEEQMAILNSSRTMNLEDFYKQQIDEENKALSRILETAPGREAVAAARHMPVDYLEKQNNLGYRDITDDINKIWYDDNKIPGESDDPRYKGNLTDIFSRL